MKNNLENLELRLIQTKLENAEKLDKIETEFKWEFGSFLDILFKNDNLWIKRFISVTYQLEKLDSWEINNLDNFKKTLNKAIEIFPINLEKRKVLFEKIIFLSKQKEIINEKFIDNSNLHKNKDFPILESLVKADILDKQDILKVSLKFKETKNFLDSIKVLDLNKIWIIKTHYFELNNTKSEDRIENFKIDFKEEIAESENIKIYPKVLKFIWKNYFKLKLKNKFESKKDRLKRMFKIAFLKLYRLKFSGIDITTIINKIDTLDDLDSMINLLLKYFEQLKQNPNLQKDYIVSDEIDEIEEIWTEAEENKEKILLSEEKMIEVSEILEENDKILEKWDLEELLSEDVEIIWKKFIKRKKINNLDLNLNKQEKVNFWIYDEYKIENLEDEDDEEEEIIDLEEYYENLKNKLDEIELKKKKLFLNWEYELLDEINDELLVLLVKLKKVWILLWEWDLD